MERTSGELGAGERGANSSRGEANKRGDGTTMEPTAETEPGDAEETKRWLLVRETLFQCPKLAKSMEEINENEWLRFRVSSLKRLLEACANFHGGPKGEMWTELTCAIARHLGPQHAFLELISDHQDSLWTTCSLMTVTTLGSETSLEKRGVFGESGVGQMSLSMAPSSSSSGVPLQQVYGSIDLIEPTGKDGQRMCMHHFHWKWLLIYVPLFLALSAAVAVAVGLLETKQEIARTVETFESTTVYLDSQQRVWYRGWEVRDCSSSGERGGVSGGDLNKTISNIQLVDSDDVEYFEENVVTDEVEGYQNSQLLKTLNGPLYLLSGSVVEYKFCLTTNFSSPAFPHLQLFSEFLIFNDITSYAHYVHQSGESGKEAAIFYKETLIPGIGQEMCSNVTFRVSKADFYFTMYKLPPHVELRYHSNIHVVYLNYTKYLPKERMECSLGTGGSCEIRIPENTFSTEDYTILAYIPLQSPDTAPNSTHLCVTPKQSVLVSVIPGVLSGFILLLLVIVLVCQIVSFLNSIKRRKGYICIKPINV